MSVSNNLPIRNYPQSGVSLVQGYPKGVDPRLGLQHEAPPQNKRKVQGIIAAIALGVTLVSAAKASADPHYVPPVESQRMLAMSGMTNVRALYAVSQRFETLVATKDDEILCRHMANEYNSYAKSFDPEVFSLESGNGVPERLDGQRCRRGAK